MKSRVRPFVAWLGIYFLCLIIGTINIGAFGSLLKVLAFVPVGIWLLQKHSIIPNKLLLLSFFFVVCCTMSCAWSIDPINSVSRTVSQVTFLTLIMSVSGYRYTTREIEYLRKCLIWSSRITAGLVLLTGSYIEGRIFLNGLVREDPNYLCAYFLFGIAAALIVLLEKRSFREKILSVVELAAYLYIIIGTGSRGGLLAVAACALVVFLFYTQRRGTDAKIMGKKFLLAIVAVFVVCIAVFFISDDVLNRFSLEDIKKTGGAGRLSLWRDALNAFANSSLFRQLFGYGTGSARAITMIFPFERHNVFHNMFIESLLELGCIGFLAYTMHVVSFTILPLRRKDYYSFSIIAGMVVLSLSTSIAVFKPYWNIMLYIQCTKLESSREKNTRSD